jgi:hypothetical protein
MFQPLVEQLCQEFRITRSNRVAAAYLIPSPGHMPSSNTSKMPGL